MGLDIGFYRQDETEALGFRNHGDLFDMIIAQPHVRVEPYDDFYVTRPMVTAVLEEIEEEMTANGLPCPLSRTATRSSSRTCGRRSPRVLLRRAR
ncbi:hypothetical protein ACFSZS_30055 [Seohaeicola zhoushanensis]